MVVSNLGTIVLSLPSATGSSASANVATQVRLLSFFNTLSRLLIGPLADVLAPVASYVDSVWAFSRKRHASRVLFVVGAALVLAATFAWLELAVRTQEAAWPLRYANPSCAYIERTNLTGTRQCRNGHRVRHDVHCAVSPQSAARMAPTEPPF